MSSSLPASLFLLSLVFWQFVSAADQNNIAVEAEPGDDVILPCKSPDQERILVAEWSRTDLGPESVLLYRNFQFDPTSQNPSYKNRVDLLVGQIQKGDASLVLKNTTIDDNGKYECHAVKSDLEKKLISSISLVVAPRPPEPVPVWAAVLLVLLVLALVLALVAAASVSFYFWLRWKPDLEQVEVKSGEKFVKLPFKVPHRLWFIKYRIFLHVDKVEWKDRNDDVVHVYQNGFDQSEEQNQIYRTRTKMDENLLKTGDLSLTLKWPIERDRGIYTCRVYNRDGEKLMEKQVNLKVKVTKVEVEPGKEFVLLPWRIRKDLDGNVKVEWRDDKYRTVHVYQNGSDQPGEQNRYYRTRTKMDENLLKNKDLSLTLMKPTDGDRGIYTCRVYNKDGDILMMKQVNLKVKVQQVEVESGMESVLLPWRIRQNLDGDVKVEWKDEENRKVHVYHKGSDQPGEQNQIYRNRTKMDENLLENKNLSLTLKWPIESDNKTFTCTVYSTKGDVLMDKDVWLKVKVQQVEVEPGVESVLLPWRTRENLDGDVKVEWMDRHNRTVHVYQNGSDQPGEQNQIYRTRTKMDENLLKNKNLSLTLKWPIDEDRGIYTCRVYNKDMNILMKKQINLQVEVQQVVVESGMKSVLLPWKITEDLGGDVKVEWKDKYNRTVHVYQNGSDQPGEQNQIYRNRTKMDENLLKNKNLSLTLMKPTDEDRGIYTCRVYNKDGDILMKKDVQLWVEVTKVEVESGVESVELPWRTREDLDEVFRVEWRDEYNRKVHVYQNGSDQPGEQNQLYKTRTKMDENLLKKKNLSLTLKWPTDEDRGIYICKVYNKDGVVLMMKDVQLWVEVPEQVEVEPGVESVLLPWRTRENLDGDVKVEWKDGYNRTVHVYQNGSDQPGEQNQIYRNRTKMDENLMKNKNLSLTLMKPTERDFGIYTCRVYNKDGDLLMEKQVNLKVKVPEQVVVESGVESVLLPCRTRENLDGDVKVEWKDGYNRTAHVYQNSSDQPGEQNQIYRTRTKMDENLLKTKDLSLTLKWLRIGDTGRFTCRVYNKDKNILMEKHVLLWVEVQQVEVEPGVESVLLPWRTRKDLDEDVKVEWRDGENRKVHVYHKGSDQPGEQNQIYRTRTKMDENLLENKNLSLTLKCPRERDRGIYTCRVYRDKNILMMKDVQLKVKAGTVQNQPEDTWRRSNPTDPLMGDQSV